MISNPPTVPICRPINNWLLKGTIGFCTFPRGQTIYHWVLQCAMTLRCPASLCDFLPNEQEIWQHICKLQSKQFLQSFPLLAHGFLPMQFLSAPKAHALAPTQKPLWQCCYDFKLTSSALHQYKSTDRRTLALQAGLHNFCKSGCAQTADMVH